MARPTIIAPEVNLSVVISGLNYSRGFFDRIQNQGATPMVPTPSCGSSGWRELSRPGAGPESPRTTPPAAFYAADKDRLHARNLFRFSSTRAAALQ